MQTDDQWIGEFLDLAAQEQQSRQIERVARFIYPRPIWAGGMDDMPQPKTARGYATAIVGMLSR